MCIRDRTNTLGIRRYVAQRTTLQREPHTVKTEWGEVAGKKVTQPNGEIRFSPEYDACAEIARREGRSVREIQTMAIQAFNSNQASS